MRFAVVLSFGALFALTGCASSIWAERRTVDAGGASGRLYVPRLFEPLLPGSMYPDRRKPVPARERPGVVVVSVRALPAGALSPLGGERLVALVLPGDAGGDAVRRAAGALAAREECRGAPIGLLLVDPPPGLARALGGDARFAAVAVAGLMPEGSASATGPPRRALVLTVLDVLNGAAPSSDLSGRYARTLGTAPVEKWYAPAGAGHRPAELWRDAAAWLADSLGKAR